MIESYFFPPQKWFFGSLWIISIILLKVELTKIHLIFLLKTLITINENLLKLLQCSFFIHA